MWRKGEREVEQTGSERKDEERRDTQRRGSQEAKEKTDRPGVRIPMCVVYERRGTDVDQVKGWE